MKIGEIGGRFSSATQLSYTSDRTFLDFDYLIVDMEFLAKNAKLLQDVNRRKKDFVEFLTHKKNPLIILAPNSQHFTLQEHHNAIPAPIFQVVTDETVTFTKKSGSVFNIIQKTPFTDFFRKYQPLFNYTIHFDSFNGTRLLESPHTKNVISFFNERLIVLPNFTRTLGLKDQTEFLADLIGCIDSLQKGEASYTLPSWASDYQLPGEQVIAKTINDINQQINLLNSELEHNTKVMMAFEAHKTLLTKSGDSLELAIKDVFEELGITILKAELNRDDLILEFNGQIIVAEIKGVTGSAAEKHAAQLEKWTSTYYSENDIKPKGVLIVNAFKDIALKDRPREVFPHQMLKFSEQREHCLVSTLQLLGLFYEIKNTPQKKAELLAELFTTIGCYPRFTNWEDVLDLVSPSDPG